MELLDEAPLDNDDEVTSIKSYANGECICEDVLEDLSQMRSIDTVQMKSVDGRRRKPNKTTYFEARCPLSFGRGGGCPHDVKISWQCAKCQEQVLY